jgi:hypothetical protein
VKGFAANVDVAEREIAELARRFVVIARDVHDLRALSRLAQDFLHDVVVRLRPEPAFAKLPSVDDVADEIQILRLVVPQEIEQIRRLAAARAEVDIGQPDRAVSMRLSARIGDAVVLARRRGFGPERFRGLRSQREGTGAQFVIAEAEGRGRVDCRSGGRVEGHWLAHRVSVCALRLPAVTEP